MPPLEVIDNADPLTKMIDFRKSAIYEMIISLRILLQPTRTHREWSIDTVSDLSPEFLDDLAELYKPFFMGHAFFELAVDYPDHLDVPGFLDYLREMSPERFMFYILGRVVRIKSLTQIDITNLDALEDLLRRENNKYADSCLALPLDIIMNDIPAFQHRLADLWQYYWDHSFKAQVEGLHEHWDYAIADRERLLQRDGGEALMNAVLGRFRGLPPALPADYPIEEIMVVPSYLLPTRAFLFYGYGNVTLLFDARLTEDHLQHVEAEKDKAMNVIRALSDNTRLSILRVIARSHGKIHGQAIAHILDISPSVVSRHLSQLKDSGLLEEVPQDNRKIHYQLQESAILELADKLLDYIYTG